MLHRGRLGPGQLRFVLAALVVVSHLTSLNIGRPAVLLFFMLSGYWVSRLYAGWQAGDAPFLISRTLRIWPLYVAVTLIAWVALSLAGADRPASPLPALMLLGLAARPGDVLGVSWSLDIELQFYLLLPLIALGLRRLSGALAAATLTLAFAAGTWLFTRHLPTVFFYLPVFMAGVLVHRSGWTPGPRQVQASLLAVLAIAVLVFLLPGWNGLLFKRAFTDSLLENLGHMAWVLGLLPVVAWNVAQPSDRMDRWLGDMSYTLYLAHLPVVKLVAVFMPMDMIGAKLLAILLTALVSLAVFVGIDRPLEARRSRLWRR